MNPEFRVLGAEDASLLEQAPEGVFDGQVNPFLAKEFLADPRHHLAAAIDEGVVVGFASGVHYVHPDKPAELFVNEVSVVPSHQNRGIATRLLEVLFQHARCLGCHEAWVLTDFGNLAARRAYAKAGGEESESPQLMITFDLAGPT